MENKNNIFYDKNTRGFYNKQNENNSRCEISVEYWQELLDKQTEGMEIVPDENGRPIAIQPVISEYGKRENRISELKDLLEKTDYIVIKLYELKIMGSAEFEAEFSRYESIMKQREEWRKEADLLLAKNQNELNG